MADQLVKKLVGILYGVIVNMDNFIFCIDYVILNYEVYFEVP